MRHVFYNTVVLIGNMNAHRNMFPMSSEISCPLLFPIVDAKVEPWPFTYSVGDVFTFTCDDELLFKNGKKIVSVECLSNGRWNSTQTECSSLYQIHFIGLFTNYNNCDPCACVDDHIGNA